MHQNITQDANYMESTIQENTSHKQYKQLDLSDKQ